MKLYKRLAELVDSSLRCQASGNVEWLRKHHDNIKASVKAHMPSGSGFDNGTTLDLNASTGEMLVFLTSFHHMNDAGVYDGWTEHKITIRASLTSDFDVKVKGSDRNGIRDYIAESFALALLTEVA